MEIDYTAWKFWLDVLQVVFTAAIGIYVWVSNRTAVNTKRIAKLEGDLDERLDEQEVRLTRVEEALRHAPTHEDLKRIHARIDDVASGVSLVSGKIGETTRTLTLIHEHLLNGGKR